MENRLQFRHDNNLYGSFQAIKEAIAAKEQELLNTPEAERDNRLAALYAEPTIFKYGDAEEPSLVLAVGSVGEGKANTSNRVYLIDIDTIKGQIEDLQGKDAHVKEIIESLSAGTEAEVARLDKKIEDETARAEAAEAVLQDNIDAEEARAEAEEEILSTLIGKMVESIDLESDGTLDFTRPRDGVYPIDKYGEFFTTDSTIVDVLMALAEGNHKVLADICNDDSTDKHGVLKNFKGVHTMFDNILNDTQVHGTHRPLESFDDTHKFIDETVEAEKARATSAETRLDNLIKETSGELSSLEGPNYKTKRDDPDQTYDAYDTIDDIMSALLKMNGTQPRELGNQIDTEIARAKAQETVLQQNIDAEVTRATTKEDILQANITAEQVRAEAAELNLQNQVNQNKVVSAGKTINITPNAGNNGTNIDVNIDNNSLVSTDGVISVRPDALTQYVGNNAAIEITGDNAQKMVNLVLDQANDFLSQSAAGLLGKIELVHEPENHAIVLYGYKENVRGQISSINTDVFTKDGFLESVYFIDSEDQRTQHDAGSTTKLPYILFTWNTAAGLDKTRVAMSSLIDTYIGSDAISISEKDTEAVRTIALKVSANNETIQGTTASKYLNVTADGLYITGINKAINDKVAEENARSIAEEQRIETRLETEENRAKDAENRIADTIGVDRDTLAYKNDDDARYLTGTTSVMGSLHVLDVELERTNDELDQEEADARAAEATLQANIDALSANTHSKINTISGDIKTTIDVERTERKTSDNNLAGVIGVTTADTIANFEGTSYVSADKTTIAAIKTLDNTVYANDNALKINTASTLARLETEENLRSGADTALNNRVDDEIARATNAETAETATRIARDVKIANAVGLNPDSLTYEKFTDSNYLNNATTVKDSLSVLDRELANVSDDLTTLSQKESAEETARKDADTALDEKITAEVTARKDGDDKLAKIILGSNATSENAAFTFSGYTDVKYVGASTNAIDSIHILDTKIQAISGTSTQSETRLEALEAFKTDMVDNKIPQLNANTTKLAGIDDGAQKNIIEAITVNSEQVNPDANKKVNLYLYGADDEITITGHSGSLTIQIASDFKNRVAELETRLAAAETVLATINTFFTNGFSRVEGGATPYVMNQSIISIDRNAITTDMLADAAVTSNKLGQFAITTEKIADKAVTSIKIADGDSGVNTIDLANNLMLDGGMIN